MPPPCHLPMQRWCIPPPVQQQGSTPFPWSTFAWVAPAKYGGEGLFQPGTGAHGLSPATGKGREVPAGVSGLRNGGVEAPAALLQCAYPPRAGTAGTEQPPPALLAAMLQF